MNDVGEQKEVEGKCLAWVVLKVHHGDTRSTSSPRSVAQGRLTRRKTQSKTFETQRNGGSGGYWQNARTKADEHEEEKPYRG
jgi:hypothetical protein